VGELLTLTGTNYAAGESQVTVNVGSIPVTVTPDSDTQISVTVPPGATSCPVTVTTTAMVDGQPLVQTSNAEDILVIWREFDLTPILTSFSDGFDGLWPGSADDLYVKIGSYWLGGGPPVLIHVKADGSWDWTPDYDHGVMNSVNDTWAYFTDTYDTTCLEYPAGPQSVCTCRAFGDCWVVGEAAFDGAGNLYVDAYTTVTGVGNLVGIWRFGPGEPILLDPNAANCLTPGGVPVLFGSWDLTVAADGTAYFLPALSQNPSCGEYVQSLMEIPAGGGAYQIFPLPSIPDCEDSAWMLVTNCMGHSFAFNYGYAVDEPNAPQYLYSVPDNTPIATLGGPNFQISDYYPITTDGYGDFYYAGRDTSTNHWLIRRVLPSDLPAGFYDNFTCCPTGVQYKDVVQKSRGEIVPLSCSTLAVTISQTGSQPVQVTQSGETVALPLGATPTLTVTSNGQPVSATWGLQNGCRTNGPDPDDLFPNDVVILFPPNGTAGAGLAAMHVGSVQITATSTSGQNSLSFTVNTVASGPLGSAHSEVDPSIYAAAEQFGIPPQYIKAMIQDESTFTATAYRYEPRTWDYGASQPGFRLRLGDPAFAPFACQEPSMTGVPGSPVAEGPLTSSWKDMRLDARYSFKLLPSFAVWNQGQGCTAVTAADDDLSAYALSLGTSAWSAVVPAGSPYKYGPCGEGEDWFEPVSVWEYDEYRAGRCPSVSNAALDFFYNNPYNAQTVLAASYGYMQVGFDALKGVDWLDQAAPNPNDLETADTNIGLGSRWLARKNGARSRRYSNTGRTSLSDFQQFFIQLCTFYNSFDKWTKSLSYGQKIVNQFAPAYQPQIPAQ
jgi:hypothetical protein